MQKRVILIFTGSRRQKTLTYTEGSFRSSHQRGSVKKVFLEISQNSQENTCARVSFLIKLQNKPVTLLKKKRLWHRNFLMNFVKFLRTPFLQNTSARLLLNVFRSEEKVKTSIEIFLRKTQHSVEGLFQSCSCQFWLTIFSNNRWTHINWFSSQLQSWNCYEITINRISNIDQFQMRQHNWNNFYQI